MFVVSSDKDMMQLVSERICVLNPPKDNLICDAAKVEEILGVPPERVVDVMALRGDSIDNIPGAPGIGDKGSVELIQRFGSVENALEHAEEVERKTYRESLQNNRDAILLSKTAGDHQDRRRCRLRAGNDARAGARCRRGTRAVYRAGVHHAGAGLSAAKASNSARPTIAMRKSAAEVEGCCGAREQAGAVLAIALESAAQRAAAAEEEKRRGAGQRAALAVGGAAGLRLRPRLLRVAISAEAGKALTLTLDDSEVAQPLKRALADEAIPKTVHDYKSAMHVFGQHGLTLAGVQHDPLLYGYLLDPTYSTYGLRETAFRTSI